MKDVVQNTCTANEEKIFVMQNKRSQFLVKNFTGATIKAYLGDNKTFSMIGANSWERVFNNYDNDGNVESVNKVRILAEQDGIVEVASIDY